MFNSAARYTLQVDVDADPTIPNSTPDRVVVPGRSSFSGESYDTSFSPYLNGRISPVEYRALIDKLNNAIQPGSKKANKFAATAIFGFLLFFILGIFWMVLFLIIGVFWLIGFLVAYCQAKNTTGYVFDTVLDEINQQTLSGGMRWQRKSITYEPRDQTVARGAPKVKKQLVWLEIELGPMSGYPQQQPMGYPPQPGMNVAPQNQGYAPQPMMQYPQQPAVQYSPQPMQYAPQTFQQLPVMQSPIMQPMPQQAPVYSTQPVMPQNVQPMQPYYAQNTGYADPLRADNAV